MRIVSFTYSLYLIFMSSPIIAAWTILASTLKLCEAIARKIRR